MDTADVQVPPWMAAAAGDATATTEANAATSRGRAWKRGKVDGHDPNGLQCRHIDDDGTDMGDHEHVARLQAALNDASVMAAAASGSNAADAVAAAGSAAPQPPTPNLQDLALERRKQEVWDQAQNESVPISMAAFAGVVAEELEEWAAAHLAQF